ncbi:MAG: NYN domain-containing protein [Dehalococcoidia bacterium]|nr:NYN domain-containing protein [Dehalococcoidia bacterium]
MPEAVAYIDGWNFYYGAVRNRPGLKWVNPRAMLERLLPHESITTIRYFSAPLVKSVADPGALARRSVYFRALATISGLVIHEGRMAIRTKRGVVLPKSTPPQLATIEVFEEKRTDVNIASHLLVDAFGGRYDTAVVVSNDSDLTTPIDMGVNQLGKGVIVVNPYPVRRQSSELRRAASRTIPAINASVLRASQFPDRLTDARGSFTRPGSWV